MSCPSVLENQCEILNALRSLLLDGISSLITVKCELTRLSWVKIDIYLSLIKSFNTLK